MRIKTCGRFFLAGILLFALLVTASGCGDDPEVIDDDLNDLEEITDEELIDEEVTEEEPFDERPEDPEDYYWPWLSHGHLALSSGEIIPGPDLFESDLGFIGEFAEGDRYEGLLVWVVEESDVFELEWVVLSFDVEYFEGSQWAFDFNFEFQIDGIEPVPADEGRQEFLLDVAEKENGFGIVIRRIVLAKGQEGMIAPDPVDYVALEIEMYIDENLE